MPRRTLALAVLAALLLAGAAIAPAASQNATVYGTVLDQNKKPMAGVKVTLANPVIALSRSTITGTDGTYTFAEVPPASGYTVTASADGRVVDVIRDLTVSVGEEARVPVAPMLGLKPLALDEVEDALTADLPRTRLIFLIDKYGVAFHLDDKLEARLRKLGADDKVIIAILKNKK